MDTDTDTKPHQLIDSLAYIDVEYSKDPQLQRRVHDLISAEMAVMAHTKGDDEIRMQYLSHLPTMEEMCKGKKYISMEKYEPLNVISDAKERCVSRLLLFFFQFFFAIDWHAHHPMAPMSISFPKTVAPS